MKRILALLLATVMLCLFSCEKVPAVVEETSAPETETPVTEAPVTEAPDTETPVTEAPVTEPPATEAPVTEPPATEAPETEEPTIELPECTAEISGIEFISSKTGKAYENCTFRVDGDTIYFGYPLVAPDTDTKNAQLRFVTDGLVEEGTYDLSSVHTITLTDEEGNSREYLLIPERLSYGLPVVEIYTNEGAPIESKTEYVRGNLYIDGERYAMRIRGRGNASWNYFPKKSYRIKLNENESLFGLASDKDWVLVSNYADKSLLRNLVAHDIASALDGLEFTSTHISVNLYLNGEYMGVYTFADKIEADEGRVDFSPIEGDEPSAFGGLDIGFLCEIGWDFESENIYNKDYFDSNNVIRIYVKEPEIEYANSAEFNYIKYYVLAMEEAIVTNNGWQNYIDVDSWVDWFIVTELTYNMESAFYRSCYFWKREGGKLMLGPVWDFDMSFGNHYGDDDYSSTWCTTESTYEYIFDNWMKYLLTYDEFKTAVKERWNEIGEIILATANESIDYHASTLDGSQQQNFIKWNIMPYTVGMGAVDPKIYDTYEKQVQYVRDFIANRWAYMDERINSEM